MVVSAWLAFPIGIAFGFVLERSGLGDPRKLAAQFTFADFTVLKVMLTAIVTAGLGLFWLAQAGWLDPMSVYLPPTNILPQVVGGVIFGAGFALGGYCPGTSCVAAAAGRGDALALLAGMLAGTVAFAEAFPLVEPLYSATPLGEVTWYEVAGISHGVGLAILVAVALAAFAAAQQAEGSAVGPRRALVLGLAALGLGGSAIVADGHGRAEPGASDRIAVPADPAPPAPSTEPGWRSAGGCGVP